MIIACNGCETRYRLGADRVPAAGLRVRCPKCRFVWRLIPPPLTIDPALEITVAEFGGPEPVAEAPAGGWNAAEPRRPLSVMTEQEPLESPQRIEIAAGAAGGPRAEPAHESPEQRKKRERARRLARVFVSDILIYNREKRDHGLDGGDLMSALGPEIKKAWEAYKEKIGSGVSDASEYFRCALNEILADGRKVF